MKGAGSELARQREISKYARVSRKGFKTGNECLYPVGYGDKRRWYRRRVGGQDRERVERVKE